MHASLALIYGPNDDNRGGSYNMVSEAIGNFENESTVLVGLVRSITLFLVI